MILGTCLLLWIVRRQSQVLGRRQVFSLTGLRLNMEHHETPKKMVCFILEDGSHSWKLPWNCHVLLSCSQYQDCTIPVGGFQFCFCCNHQPDPASWLVANMVMSSQLSFGVSNFEFRLWPQVQPPKKRTEYLITHSPVAETLLSTCLNYPNHLAFSLDWPVCWTRGWGSLKWFVRLEPGYVIGVMWNKIQFSTRRPNIPQLMGYLSNHMGMSQENMATG